jgi:hypothetical protein
VMGFDDQLLQRKVRSIPREDLAEVCVNSLQFKEAINRSFDVIVDEELPLRRDWKAFFNQRGNCKY